MALAKGLACGEGFPVIAADVRPRGFRIFVPWDRFPRPHNPEFRHLATAHASVEEWLNGHGYSVVAVGDVTDPETETP